MAFAGFQDNGRGHDPGMTFNVAANDHYRTYLGNNPSQPGNDSPKDSEAGFAHHRPGG